MIADDQAGMPAAEEIRQRDREGEYAGVKGRGGGTGH